MLPKTLGCLQGSGTAVQPEIKADFPSFVHTGVGGLCTSTQLMDVMLKAGKALLTKPPRAVSVRPCHEDLRR